MLYGKLYHYNDREICGKLLLNETLESPVTLVCLPSDFLELKTVDTLYNLYIVQQL
jgi:hypothetical protein